MCERAILLQDKISYLLNTEPLLELNYLTPTDWGYLTNIRDFLKPFRVLTKVNGGILDAIN